MEPATGDVVVRSVSGRKTGNLLARRVLSSDAAQAASEKKARAVRTKTTAADTCGSYQLPPCKVCGHAASGFHYGVNACEACKRFFRRATRRKRLLKCKGVKQCSLRGSERSLCAYCRYMRCLSLGMSSTSSKTGRYSHEKRAQITREVRKLRLQTHDALHVPEAEVTDVVEALTEGQTHLRTNDTVPAEVIVERLRRKHEEFSLLQTLIGPHRVLSLEEYSDVYERTGLDVDGRKQRIETWMINAENCVDGVVRFCKSVPGFRDLSIVDQTNLLKQSRVEVWFLGAYKGFDADLKTVHVPNGNCFHRFELSQFLGQDYVDCALQLAVRLKSLGLTSEETVVLKAICVMSADRCALDQPREVEERHWDLVKCLLHLLAKDESRGPGLFARVVSALIALRTLSEFAGQHIKNTLVADAARNHPMMLELLVG